MGKNKKAKAYMVGIVKDMQETFEDIGSMQDSIYVFLEDNEENRTMAALLMMNGMSKEAMWNLRN